MLYYRLFLFNFFNYTGNWSVRVVHIFTILQCLFIFFITFNMIIKLIFISLYILKISPFDIRVILADFLICFIGELYTIDTGLVFTWGEDEIFKYYPWLNHNSDKFTNPNGGPNNNPNKWPLDDNFFRKNRNYRELKKEHKDLLSPGETVDSLVEKVFGPYDIRYIVTIEGEKHYLKDITSVDLLQSTKHTHFLKLGYMKHSEYGLRMHFYTKSGPLPGPVFDYVDIMYPTKHTIRVHDEATLVKIMIKQKDIAGVHYFCNGSGRPQPHLYRMKAIYNLENKRLVGDSSTTTRDISIPNLLND